MESPWSLDKKNYSDLLSSEPKFRVEQIWDGLYLRGNSISDISTLPDQIRTQLSEDLSPSLNPIAVQSSEDKLTSKWLFELPDKATIETVLMHYEQRSTVCISSQAGCAMACGFCATGQAGYTRNLTLGEILEQIVAAQNACKALDRRLSNVVFMGMGEPMANFPIVLRSLKRIMNDLQIGARNITVSTIGLIPQMNNLAKEKLQIGLAVSLHAANDELRTELIPINKRYPLKDLVVACKNYRELTGRRVSFEWAMIEDTNDSDTDAIQLAEIATEANAHVNLIPLNPTPGWPTKGSSKQQINTFVEILEDEGVNVTVRKNRGVEISAACGQLATETKSTKVKITKKQDEPK